MERSDPRAVVADERDARHASSRPASTASSWCVPDERLLEARAGTRGGARPRGPGADRLHLRDLGRAQADPPRPALPDGPARPGRALVRRPRRRPVLVHRRQRLVEVGPQLRSSPRGCAAPPRCCTTRASTPTSAWRWSSASASTCSAWPPPSTARSPSAPSCGPLAALRHAVAAGEPLNPEIVRAWRGGGRGGDPRRLRPDRDRRA